MTVAFAASSAIALSACGKDKTPVAHVGDTVITRADFNRELHRNQQPVPDPPTYEKCIARMRSGGAAGDTAALKAACRYQYVLDASNVMSLLIHVAWLRQEAKAEGIAITDADLSKAKDQFGPGFSKDEKKAILLEETLKPKLAPATVNEAEVNALYNKVRATKARRRNVIAVATLTRADADEARRLVESGQTFEAVAQKFAGDWRQLVGDKQPVGRLWDVTEDPQADPDGYVADAALRKAIFEPRFATLTGPVPGGRGYYVFEVVGSGRPPASRLALKRSDLVAILKDQGQAERFEQILRSRWLKKTTCENGYIIGRGLQPQGGLLFPNYSQSGCRNFVPFKTDGPG